MIIFYPEKHVQHQTWQFACQDEFLRLAREHHLQFYTVKHKKHTKIFVIVTLKK